MKCKVCGNELPKRNKITCSYKCYGIYQRQKEKKIINCVICGKKLIWANKNTCSYHCAGIYRTQNYPNNAKSPEARKKLHRTQLGKNNSGWKGGISNKYWLRLKKEKLPKKCEKCNSTNHLEVHHKNKNNKDNKLNNLQILCSGCHHKEHALLNKLEVV